MLFTAQLPIIPPLEQDKLETSIHVYIILLCLANLAISCHFANGSYSNLFFFSTSLADFDMTLIHLTEKNTSSTDTIPTSYTQICSSKLSCPSINSPLMASPTPSGLSAPACILLAHGLPSTSHWPESQAGQIVEPYHHQPYTNSSLPSTMLSLIIRSNIHHLHSGQDDDEEEEARY